MKDKTIKIILILFTILLIVSIVLVVMVFKKNAACVANPFTYAAKSIVTQDAAGNFGYTLCSCNVNEQMFYFDSEGIYKNNPILNPN